MSETTVSKVKLPSGEVVSVQHPVGATREQIFKFAKQHKQPDVGVAGVADATRVVGQNVGAESLAGLAGVAAKFGLDVNDLLLKMAGMEGPNKEQRTGHAVDVMNATREGLSGVPSTEGGRQALENVGDVAQTIDRLPGKVMGGDQTISGGLQAARDTMGDTVMDVTGSPELATAAYTGPDAALAYLGGRGVQSGTKGAKVAASKIPQSPQKQAVGQSLAQKTGDVNTARFDLVPDQPPAALPAPANKPPATGFEQPPVPRAPKVKSSPTGIEAINNGFDEGVVAAVKVASPTDKSLMRTMVDTLEKGKKNAKFRMQRPSDVLGNEVMKRFNAVATAKSKAGQAVDAAAKSLRGQRVDVSGPINRFMEQLDDIGVTLDDTLKPVFRGSRVEGLKDAEAAIARIVKRLRQTDVPDAYDVHRMKQYIDEVVNYAKEGGKKKGLSAKVEGIFKGLRHDLDELLDARFDTYNKANTRYAELTEALNAFDKASKSINLGAESADMAVGVLMRRLMSNVQSRGELIDAIKILDDAAKTVGPFDNDLVLLAQFADDLDSVFGPVAKTSFQGQIGQAVGRAADTAMDVKSGGIWSAGRRFFKGKERTQEDALKAIRRLLEEGGG